MQKIYILKGVNSIFILPKIYFTFITAELKEGDTF